MRAESTLADQSQPAQVIAEKDCPSFAPNLFSASSALDPEYRIASIATERRSATEKSDAETSSSFGSTAARV
jgi:hypothetical protein